MERSTKFKHVITYYKRGLWDEKRVRDAVGKGWITAEEFAEITGSTYNEQYQD